MSGEDIRRYTFAEIKRMVEAGETRSDWDRVRNMAEEELERSIADDPDWRDLIVDWEGDVVPSGEEGGGDAFDRSGGGRLVPSAGW